MNMFYVHNRSSFVHSTLLGANKYIIENVANPNRLPPVGSTIIILPLNVQGTAESPVRMIGLIPK